MTIGSWVRKPVLQGMVLGVALVFVVREGINKTLVADWLVAPLGRPDTGGQADVMVVLGAGLTALCTPNAYSLQRVLLAAQLFHDGRAPVVLFTGGRPAGSTCAVSEAMQELAVRLGVPAGQIRVEASSTSTWQNAVRSDAVLSTLGARRILLVTDRSHMQRAEASFRRFGYDIERASVPIQLGHPDNVSVLWTGLREYAATGYYIWRGYVGEQREPRALVTTVAQSDGKGSEQTAMNTGVKSTWQGGPVVLLGASYAKGWNPTGPVAIRFVNKGVAGQQSYELLQRFDTDVVAEQPRAVIIWGFINDVFRSPRADLDKTMARVRESYLAMLDRCRSLGITPILATEVTLGPKAGLSEIAMTWVGSALGKQSYMDFVNRHVLDTNAWIREVARREGILLLDLETVLSNGSRRRKAYTAADGSHLTPAAYDALSRYAEAVLGEQAER